MEIQLVNPFRYRYDLKCDCCGRFIKREELLIGGGGSSCFIPDSEVSYEEEKFRCKKCTEAEGRCLPNQSGMNLDVCCQTFI